MKNAFLHGDLKEEVYIKLPTVMPSLLNIVFKLKYSLYGLKHALKVLFEMFRTTLPRFFFLQSSYDPSLFVQQTSKGIVTLLEVC